VSELVPSEFTQKTKVEGTAMAIQTFAELLREYMGSMEQQHLSQESGISRGYLSGILKGKKKNPSEQVVNRLAVALKLEKQKKDNLLRLAGYVPAEQVSIEDVTLKRVFEALSDPEIPEDVKQCMEEDIATIVQGWQAHVRVKRNQYYQDWEETVRECKKTAEEVERMELRLSLHLLDSQAVAYLHLGKTRHAEELLSRIELSFEQTDAEQMDDERQNGEHRVKQQRLLKGLTLVHQGDVYRDQGKFKDAIDKYTDAKKEFKWLNEAQEVDRVTRKLALIDLFLGNPATTQSTLEDCVHRFVEAENAVECAQTYYALGWAYNLAGLWERAEKSHSDGLEWAKRHQSPNQWEANYLLMSGYAHLGYDRMQTGRYKEARENFETAQQISRRLGEQRERGWILLGLARVGYYEGREHLKHGRNREAQNCFKDAEGFFQEAQENHDATGFRFRQAVSLIQYAKFLLKIKNDKAGAIVKLTRALSIAENLGSNYYVNKANLYLCEVYRQLGRGEAEKLHDLFGKLIIGISSSHSKYLKAHWCCVQALIKADLGQHQKAAADFALAFYHAIHFHPQVANKVRVLFREALLKMPEQEKSANTDPGWFCGEVLTAFEQQLQTNRINDLDRKDEALVLISQLGDLKRSIKLETRLENALDRHGF
jgi:tetratricopeptide (TPR) repeat protein